MASGLELDYLLSQSGAELHLGHPLGLSRGRDLARAESSKLGTAGSAVARSRPRMSPAVLGGEGAPLFGKNILLSPGMPRVPSSPPL